MNGPGVDLSVVVPAYNEELRLPSMLDETVTFLEDRYDGSTDRTTECCQKYGEKYNCHRIRVITLPENKGKGGAVKAGVLAARGNFIMFADADGASKFSDVIKLEDFMYENRNKDLVLAIGSRAHLEEEAIASRSLFRTILMKGFHLLVWICCVRTVRDTQCGFKMFNRLAAKLLFNHCHNQSWAFDVELLYLAEKIKCTIGEVAISWQEVDGSKIVPVFSWIRMGWDVICLATLYTFGVYRIPYDQATKVRGTKID